MKIKVRGGDRGPGAAHLAQPRAEPPQGKRDAHPRGEEAAQAGGDHRGHGHQVGGRERVRALDRRQALHGECVLVLIAFESPVCLQRTHALLFYCEEVVHFCCCCAVLHYARSRHVASHRIAVEARARFVVVVRPPPKDKESVKSFIR